MIYIGIDAGTKTGLAFWDNEKKGLDIMTTDFWGCVDHITKYYHPDSAKIIIEDPNKTRAIFFGNKGSSNFRTDLKVAQSVGGVKRESLLLADGLEKAGFNVTRTKPNNTKKDAAYIRRVTGYSGRTDEHTRDAIMMVYGR